MHLNVYYFVFKKMASSKQFPVLVLDTEHTGFAKKGDIRIFTQIACGIFTCPLRLSEEDLNHSDLFLYIYNSRNSCAHLNEYIKGAKKLNYHKKARTRDEEGNFLTVEYLNENGKSSFFCKHNVLF